MDFFFLTFALGEIDVDVVGVYLSAVVGGCCCWGGRSTWSFRRG